MTRFQASGPRVSYTPQPTLKPFKQLVGLYDMWQSLSPETRDWIASLFDDDVLDTKTSTERDPILDYQNSIGSDTYDKIYVDEPESWERRDAFNLNPSTRPASPAANVSLEPPKAVGPRPEMAPALLLGWRDLFENPGVFNAPSDTINDLPTGHYAFDPKSWRGL